MEIIVENYSIAPIQKKDSWRLCNFVVSNERYLKDYFPNTLKENYTPTLSELFTHKMVKRFEERLEYLFVVKENANRTIMALAYVKELQKVKGQGEIAYCIGYPYKGKGLMTKIVGKICEWSFGVAQISRLQAIIHESNIASRRVAEKNKFKYVKVLPKEHKMSDGSLADMQLYELEKTILG